MPFGQVAVGGPLGEQPYGGLIQFTMILFQTDDQVPADLVSQLKTEACA